MLITEDEKRILHADVRIESFEYHILDRFDQPKSLNGKPFISDKVKGGVVDYKSLSTLKRSGSLIMEKDNNIDYLNDRIKIYCNIKSTHGTFRRSLGVFLISTSADKHTATDTLVDCQLYSKLHILEDIKLEERLVIALGTNVTNEIERLINIAGEVNKSAITPSVQTLARAREWEIGTTYLQVINDLLKSINYTSLRDREDGYFVATPYVLPSEREVDYEYVDDDMSVMDTDLEETLDRFNVPNVFIRFVSNVDGTPLKSTYVNDNPQSATSTVSRARRIVDFAPIEDATDQSTLNDMTKRIAYNASTAYSKIVFTSAIMPFHDYMNSLYLQYHRHDKEIISSQYEETAWSIPLKVGGEMRHEVRRVVYI